MNEAKKFTKDLGIIGATNLIVSLSGIVLLPLLTKTLGVHDYGIWIQVDVTIRLATAIFILGLPFAMVRFLAGEKDKRKIQEGFFSVILLVFFVSLVPSVLLLAFSKSLAVTFFGGAEEIVKIIALIIPIACVNLVFASFFRAFREMKKYSVFAILQTYGKVGLITYLVLSGYGVFGAVISILIVLSALDLVMFYLITSKIGIKLPNFSRMKEYLNFSLPTVPSMMSSWIVRESDRYLIGYFLGVTYVGFYSPGYILGSIIMIFLASFAFVLPPTLSKLYDENQWGEVRKSLRYSLKY